MSTRLRIAVIGDVHLAWTDADVAYFDGSDYDAILFVGDLPDLNHGRAYEVAARIATLRKPVYLIPGNHDAVTLRQLLAELSGQRILCELTARGHGARADKLRSSLHGATLCGYSHHHLTDDIGLIAARPHAMGATFTFAPYLERIHGVHSMEESAERLCALVEASPCSRLIFLAHNGPTSLGDAKTDIWGCDFRRSGGDWGDPDLRRAIDFARGTGRQVLAVVAGHMHRLTKQKKNRTWHVVEDGTHYVNAAQVPRIFKHQDAWVRHHVSLTIDSSGCEVEDRLVPTQEA